MIVCALVDYPDAPWIPSMTCEAVTNVILTIEALEKRIEKLLDKMYETKYEAETAINDALVHSV